MLQLPLLHPCERFNAKKTKAKLKIHFSPQSGVLKEMCLKENTPPGWKSLCLSQKAKSQITELSSNYQASTCGYMCQQKKNRKLLDSASHKDINEEIINSPITLHYVLVKSTLTVISTFQPWYLNHRTLRW